MTRHVASVSPATPIQQALSIMEAREIGQLIIADDGELFGTVSYREMALSGADWSKPVLSVAELLQTYCFEEDEAAAAVGMIEVLGLNALPVKNATGTFSGIVTRASIDFIRSVPST